jgi:hypothetical protein
MIIQLSISKHILRHVFLIVGSVCKIRNYVLFLMCGLNFTGSKLPHGLAVRVSPKVRKVS